MNLKSVLVPLIGACFALLYANAAHATIIVHTTQSSYLAAISAPGVDTYDDLDPTDTLSTPQTRTAGPYGYTASAGPLFSFFPAGTLGGDVWLTVDENTDTITFDGFSSGVRGVGGYFFRTDSNGLVSATPATINVTATDASGTVAQGLVNPAVTTFLGFVSDGNLSNVKVFVGTAGVGSPDVWPTVNNLTLGAAVASVPVPQTYVSLLMGLAMLSLTVRRNKA
jgi:hypothetical protein